MQENDKNEGKRNNKIEYENVNKYDNNKRNTSAENIDKNENMEDVTKYGEFVSSYFAWLTPERQKKRAKEIDDMTKSSSEKLKAIL